MVSPTVESFPETSREIIESEEFNPPVNVSGELFTESSMEILESEEFNTPMFTSTESFPESAPAIDESSIYEPEPCPPAEPANQPLTFNVIDGATEKGKRKLIYSWGFSYNKEAGHHGNRLAMQRATEGKKALNSSSHNLFTIAFRLR